MKSRDAAAAASGDGDGDGKRYGEVEDAGMVCDGPVFERLVWNLLAPCQRGSGVKGQEEEEQEGNQSPAEHGAEKKKEKQESRDQISAASTPVLHGKFGRIPTRSTSDTAGVSADTEDLIAGYEALALEERGVDDGKGAEGGGGRYEKGEVGGGAKNGKVVERRGAPC
ncbi:hypothetical protein EJ03DRAFT_386332 [Teratosphaeria nubilosa]|uniref:Uncharacterized protein n=1 Tax=Teratosphaeria nubilosa TaxID=161662 RepID=A0A6G1KUN8_9PEZI|nr:hypothetical protein EJ03DRAFT_386332 [Teratosphaeria nubilosa]